MAKSALGKGLGALIGTRPAPALDSQMVQFDPGEKVHQVNLGDIVASPLQPRHEFAPEALQELVDSIRQHGIIQPLIVRMVNGKHELIAGERRWRAAREVGLTQAPVIVREATDLDVLELSLIENLQRADLNPIEEALAYARLAGEFGMRQEDIALKVGRSRAAVANSMRLLDLHQQVQSWVTQGLLSVGHAKVLLGLKAHDEQLAVAETILRRSATVRDAERLVSRQLGTARRRRRAPSTATVTSATIADLQNLNGLLEARGYSGEDIEKVFYKNWMRFLEKNLSSS